MVGHHIETGDSRPACTHTTIVREKVCGPRTEFRVMEQAGIVSGSTGSLWAAPLHMVKKPGLDDWRPCGDYRSLNTRTITDSYVIPRIHSLNFQFKGKQVFS